MKKLYRSSTNKMIAGVCGGIGEYFEIDPTVIRLIFVLLLLPGGLPGLLPYLILWVVMPQRPTGAVDDADAKEPPHQSGGQ